MNTDKSLATDKYEPTPAELAGIDRGLHDAAKGRFATKRQVKTAFAALRRA